MMSAMKSDDVHLFDFFQHKGVGVLDRIGQKGET